MRLESLRAAKKEKERADHHFKMGLFEETLNLNRDSVLGLVEETRSCRDDSSIFNQDHELSAIQTLHADKYSDVDRVSRDGSVNDKVSEIDEDMG